MRGGGPGGLITRGSVNLADRIPPRSARTAAPPAWRIGRDAMNFAAWTVLAVVLSAATAFADATTSPGKNSVYVSQLAASIDGAGTHAIVGSIAKGKSGAAVSKSDHSC
jgi:hypothetical protein